MLVRACLVCVFSVCASVLRKESVSCYGDKLTVSQAFNKFNALDNRFSINTEHEGAQESPGAKTGPSL